MNFACASIVVAAFLATPRAPSDDVVETVARQVESGYFDADKGRALATALRDKAKSGAFDTHGDPRELADRLTSALRAVVPDKHLKVRAPNDERERAAPRFRPGNPAEDRQYWATRNAGIESIERMQGNVGYLELRALPGPEHVRAKIAATFELLGDTDALIIDLRRNPGGDGETVRQWCSRLFGKERVHLNDVRFREGDRTMEFWTDPDVEGRRYLDKPVFVLTSSETFSAAEELAYDLQCQKRARVVGEASGGGAHPVAFRDLPEGFTLSLPIARSVNPVTHEDWEERGVQPDVACKSAQAKDVAYEAALTLLASRCEDAERKTQLSQLLHDVRANSAALSAK